MTVLPPRSSKTSRGGEPLPAQLDPQQVPKSWQAPPTVAELAGKGELFVKADPRGGLTADFERLVESLFEEDITADYKQVEQSLKLGEERTDYASVLEALDRAEDSARVAHRLFINAKLEQKRYEIDREAIEAVMRREAMRALQKEKELGERSKAITNDDVAAMMAELHPDEVQAVKLKEERIKRACEHLEFVADLGRSRCRSLQVILSTMRK